MLKTEEQLISEVVDEYFGDKIKQTYAQESGLDLKDPGFVEKYNAWRESQPEPEYNETRCPHCGQIIED